MTLPSSLGRKLLQTMTSAGVAAEQGFLKLVYPKRRIELLRHPITAAQVLERNPRCYVARPDVFKYPWVVVRPESVLSLGRVFYIVPRHTIHRLLQQHGTSSPMKPQPPLQKQPSSHPRREQNLSRTAEITPRRKTYHGEEFIDLISSDDDDRDSNYIELRPCMPLNDRELAHFHREEHHNRQVASSQIKIVNQEIKEDSDNSIVRQRVSRSSNSNRVYSHIDKPPKTDKQEQRLCVIEPQKKQYPIEHWPINRDTKKHHYHQLKPFDSCRSLRRNNGVIESSGSTTVKFSSLKSCLKKATSGSPRLQHLKVSFNEEIEVYDLNERIFTS
ncbi:hypothetical protein POM88_049530 [Heracleum sosnowskyi]|uniref:Uncharacterized protein n=1 Tax=Heracleum sosnowskyi TaxID=360622 RepID=A0AAD8GX40_9APIA|nr:hypothetical protein POM88_049530 [Heracleum sosnowskyi]